MIEIQKDTNTYCKQLAEFGDKCTSMKLSSQFMP